MNNLIRLRDGVAEVCRDDPWQLLRELPDALPPGPLLLPLAAWLERRGAALLCEHLQPHGALVEGEHPVEVADRERDRAHFGQVGQ